ncbi:hypothetical protein SAMD00019534_113880, partial [Acytostelium subglobosum LB1]|uniref:hypothetical protein n=1 Tax=Acytostelium subglobosum LB1 TaxID=1410327 RepID=UPI000644B282
MLTITTRRALLSVRHIYNNIRAYSNSSNISNNNNNKMPGNVPITKKIDTLRQLMNKHSYTCYVVPSDDAHQSEYVTEHDQRRAYISNFTGSAGTAVITTEQCYLWTDGRYWLQASQQLDPSWKVMKDRVEGEPSIEEFISKSMPATTIVGMDSRLISKGAFEKFKKTLAKGQEVVTSENNLIDQVKEELKSLEPMTTQPTDPIFFLPETYSGKSNTDKIKDVQDRMAKENVDYVVITALDEIAMEEEMNVKNNTQLTEFSVSEVLEQYRTKQKDFVSLSFASISSIGSNGAIIHYKPEEDTCKKITKEVYLIDSGGQYKDGTTDVTRTTHYGTPSQHEIDCYTRVLKGHIQLSIIKFPAKVTGKDIDCVARIALWQAGLDYAHGTGHGVGSFLNVHEGPQGISMRPNSTILHANMTITNEPGYYEEGNFGIRIENIMLTVPVETQFNNSKFLGFESITMVPYERDLINVSMLTNDELAFVNHYHEQVQSKLAPHLSNDQRALAYLQKKTAKITRQ